MTDYGFETSKVHAHCFPKSPDIVAIKMDGWILQVSLLSLVLLLIS